MNNYNYNRLTPFKWFILENFPLIDEDFDALTNWQLFCKLGKEINKIIKSENDLGTQMENVTNAFITLQNYVDNYFDNLDVQDEIDNKLDDLVEDGTLTTLIGNYIQPRIDQQNAEIQYFEQQTNMALAGQEADLETFKNETNANLIAQNANISNIQSSTESALADFQTQLDAVTSGAPLVASSTSEMVNTSRIYVNTTDGNWYYYNGSAWTVGGTYQASGLSDNSVTLNILGNDVLFNLDNRINDTDVYDINDVIPIDLVNNTVNKSIGDNGVLNPTTQPTRISTPYYIYMPRQSIFRLKTNTTPVQIEMFLYDKNFNIIGSKINVTTNLSNNTINGTFPYSYTYCRFKFLNGSNELSPSDIYNTVSMVFEKNPIFYDSYNNTIGTNKLNPNFYVNGFIWGSSGIAPYQLGTSGTYKTYAVKVKANQPYFVSAFRKFALYDTNLNYIENTYVTNATTNYQFTPAKDGYAIFSHNTTNVFLCEGTSGTYTPYIESLPSYVQLTNVDNLSSIMDTTNILFGKKYTALGDSFTHGDFSNSPTDDYTIESGTYSGQYKVYPYLIGNRNGMTINNLAVNGMTLTNVNGTSENYLSDTVLSNIDSDVDYITIKIGINDHHQNAPIGTISDTTSLTFYGSFNRVMTYLITNYPNAKIGIIVSNGIPNINYVNATINIAKKYGVSYYNETTDEKVPLLIRTLREDVSSTIKSARDNYYEVLPRNKSAP